MKKLSRTDFLASSYSFGVSASDSWANSLLHCSFSESKACARPPQPTYFDRISCSSGVAVLSSLSICFNVWMASRLFLNLVFAPPSPRLSSVMVKFCVFSSALICCSNFSSGAAIFSGLISDFSVLDPRRFLRSISFCVIYLSCWIRSAVSFATSVQLKSNVSLLIPLSTLRSVKCMPFESWSTEKILPSAVWPPVPYSFFRKSANSWLLGLFSWKNSAMRNLPPSNPLPRMISLCSSSKRLTSATGSPYCTGVMVCADTDGFTGSDSPNRVNCSYSFFPFPKGLNSLSSATNPSPASAMAFSSNSGASSEISVSDDFSVIGSSFTSSFSGATSWTSVISASTRFQRLIYSSAIFFASAVFFAWQRIGEFVPLSLS